MITEHDFITAFNDITYNANGLMVLNCYNVFCVEARNLIYFNSDKTMAYYITVTFGLQR
jgi:hypothetical protein